MNLFEIIKNLQTERNSLWINDLEDNEIQPVVINKFLMMDWQLLPFAKYLDEFTFSLNSKHWLLLAWSVIPKGQSKYIKFLKKKDEEDNLEELWIKIRKFYDASENDMKIIKTYLRPLIENNKEEWFKMFGMDKKFWEKNGAGYDNIKSGGVKEGKGGLELFGL